ncbi:MAG: right-handed parallel beta-helix repeat-containing protein, partial [Clostridia bacterium]|nr:right-handed parallel beta-helix repeat-containing protein [Clostridia bacterium]
HVAVYMEPEEYKNFFIHKTYQMTGRYVFMKNALAYVDSQGEYYYDEPTGKLYYYWAGDISDKSFARATSDYMLYFKNADNITVSGLRITGLDDAYLSHNDGCVSLGNTGGAPGAWDRGSEHGFTFDRAAIVFDSGNNLAVYDCDFAELGTRGIFGRHMLKNVTIEDNTFTRLGAGAIHLGAGGEQRTYSEGKSEFENIAIINNYVHDIAREYYSSFGIFTAFGKNVEILHNTVTKCSYSAIGLGLYYSFVSFDPTTSSSYHIYNAEIAYNYVGDFMQQIGDGGGIYVTGASADKTITGYMNYLHDNYVLFTKDTGNALNMVCGLYFDGAASNWHVYNNVIVQQSYGAYSGEGDGTLDAEYLQNMRKRRYNTYLIYLQRIASQFAYNILCENNYILNVRATDPEAQKDEVFRRGSINGVEKSLVDPTRNLEERSTHYIKDVSRIPIPAEEIIYAAGAPGYEGMADDLWNNDY